MIEREAIEEMFAATRANPRVRWDIDGVCLWGFFFQDKSAERLAAAGEELARRGFRVVAIEQQESEDPEEDPDEWTLHVERVEQHTVDSLVARGDEFAALARAHGLLSYDGMDVGPAPGSRWA